MANCVGRGAKVLQRRIPKVRSGGDAPHPVVHHHRHVFNIIIGMPHICGMDTYGMKIMPQMSGIAFFQDIYGMLIFEDEHAIDV